MKLIRDIVSMDDLGISNPTTLGTLQRKGHTPATVVAAARTNTLTYLDGIGRTKATEITEDLKKSGYIDDESVLSVRMCRLYGKVGIISYRTTRGYLDYVEFVQEQIDEVPRILETLTPREEKVILMRYGLAGEAPLTMEECGKQFNLESSRIGQIEAKAMQKLRESSRRHRLEDLLPGNQAEVKRLRKEVEAVFDSPVDRMLLEDLHLPRSICERLSRAGVKCVGHLRAVKLGDLVKIPELKLEEMERIIEELRDIVNPSR